jgi:hypothetical protein
LRFATKATTGSLATGRPGAVQCTTKRQPNVPPSARAPPNGVLIIRTTRMCASTQQRPLMSERAVRTHTSHVTAAAVSRHAPAPEATAHPLPSHLAPQKHAGTACTQRCGEVDMVAAGTSPGSRLASWHPELLAPLSASASAPTSNSGCTAEVQPGKPHNASGAAASAWAAVCDVGWGGGGGGSCAATPLTRSKSHSARPPGPSGQPAVTRTLQDIGVLRGWARMPDCPWRSALRGRGQIGNAPAADSRCSRRGGHATARRRATQARLPSAHPLSGTAA